MTGQLERGIMRVTREELTPEQRYYYDLANEGKVPPGCDPSKLLITREDPRGNEDCRPRGYLACHFRVARGDE